LPTRPICSAPACDHPSPNGYLCTVCMGNLRRDLRAVPGLLKDLAVTISKQDRLSDPSGRKGDEHPLPLKLGPMEARRDLTATLTAWVCHVAARVAPTEPVEFSPAMSAVYLLHYLDFGTIQRDEEAGDLADEIGYAVIQAQRATDKSLQLQYAGPCDECGTDLYGRPKTAEVKCENCQRTYPIAERRKWLLEHVEDMLLTAAEMSRALPNLLQQQLTSAMIRGWAHRGKLTQHPPDPRDPRCPLYRLGDVVDLVHEVTRAGIAS
jgi:hypothetical protein